MGDGERNIESRLSSQIKEEWVKEVFIHQKLQTLTHSLSSGLSVPRRSLMNWRAEGGSGEKRRRTSAPTSFYFPPQQLSTSEREYRSTSCHPHSTHLRRSKILISQQNWDFSNTVSKWHIPLCGNKNVSLYKEQKLMLKHRGGLI